MKKMFSLIAVATAVLFFNPAGAQEKAKWNEMEAFHEIISKTFHPAEEGKLEPIRTRSQEMVDKATAWKKSTAPAGYDKNAVKLSLDKLVKGAKEVNKLVQKKATDKQIKDQLSSVHDVFHEIMEKCQKEDHQEKEEHHQ